MSWREGLANKLSLAALVGLSAAVLVGLVTTSTSPRVMSITMFVFVPALALLAIERLIGAADYRVRAWLTIATLVLVGVSASSAVGLIGGAASAIFLALILTSLLFGLRAMLLVLGLVTVAVSTTAWLMVSGAIAPPLAEDVSFAFAGTWLRTAANTLVLVGLGAVATAQFVNELERALARVKREAADRERAQEERARALELALQSQKVEVVGRLAAGLAHDLNNALFVIDACNQSLQLRKMSDADRLETHVAIADAVAQSSSMARQLLTFARKHVVSPVPLSTRDLLEELRRSLARLFPADMKVTVECDEDATVRADRVHLQQAILNLAINARDAMSAGGEITVIASTSKISEPHAAINGVVAPGLYATFEVRDTGTGMDPTTRERAFEPLFTTKPEGKGTGLGLASVLSTVEMSKGAITVWTEPNRGTRIKIYLPRIADAARPAQTASSPSPALDLHGINVLLAEDSPQVRGVISSALTQHGCTVLQAQDGTAALDQIERTTTPIDVLCTDAVMPGAPVRDVIARLQHKHPKASVVVISGYVIDELTRRGIEQGDYRVLAKPFETRALLETISELRRGMQPGAHGAR